MRKFVLLLAVLACAFPLGALGARNAAGDGTLDVSGLTPVTGASGQLSLSGKGVVFGYVAAGAITVYGYRADGNSVPTVSGAKMKLSDKATSVVYTGTNMRFLFPGGRYKIEIDGTGIDISAVGNGVVSALGSGSLMTDSVAVTLGRAATTAYWGYGATGATGVTTVAGGKST